MKRLVWTCVWAVLSLVGWGQTDRNLDETSVRSPHLGLVFGTMAPQGDWGSQFGAFGQIGLMAGLKTEGNGYVYVKATSWSGADVNTIGLLSDLMNDQGHIIDNEGDIAQITVTGRGGQFGLGLGRVFPTAASNPNSGWMLKGGLGSIHHNVHFDYTENRIGPLEDDRVKGYDRMRWGWYLEVWFGYWLMSSDQRINAFAGLSTGVAETLSLRAVNFDTLEPNEVRVLEGWIGLEAGWAFHIYKRVQKEYWY